MQYETGVRVRLVHFRVPCELAPGGISVSVRVQYRHFEKQRSLGIKFCLSAWFIRLLGSELGLELGLRLRLLCGHDYCRQKYCKVHMKVRIWVMLT